MPPRLVCLVLLVYWAAAAAGLITRDLLPELGSASPPDFRTLARAGDAEGPTRWSVMVMDDPAFPEMLHTVGEAVTDSRRRPDGVTLTSHLRVNARGLLANTALRTREDVKLEVASTYDVDPSGNLRALEARVKSEGDPYDLLTVHGTVKNRAIELTLRSELPPLQPLLNKTLRFPYAPRGLVQDPLAPVDRLPGLHLGQRWETRVVNPLTGRSDVARALVARRTIIQWGKNPVTVFEVVQQLTPISARTWVRGDGLVLRQEVPLALVKLILERQPDRASGAGAGPDLGNP